MIEKEAVLAFFTLLWYSPGGTKEKHDNLQSGQVDPTAEARSLFFPNKSKKSTSREIDL
jgi:hypothetical protein